MIYNLIVAVLYTVTMLFTKDVADSEIIHFIFSGIIILFDILLFFIIYPKFVDEKHSKKIIILLSIVLFIYSTIIAIIW